MSTLNSPTTAMALSGLEGKERVDGSAIFNMLRQISSSLASTLSVLIFTHTGNNIAAVHCVYIYYSLVTVVVAVTVVIYLKSESRRHP